MALTRADVEMWREIAPLVPASPRVLEIGQANWYNDVSPDVRDLPTSTTSANDPATLFVIARNFYLRHMPGATFAAVDRHGREDDRTVLRGDLNKPIGARSDGPFGYEVIINTGTCEHVFNQAQVFTTIHESCVPGGLMIHAAPLTGGWWNHGFYCYSPTFFADLQAANGYELVYLSQFDFTRGIVQALSGYAWVKPGPGDQMLYVVWRKTTDRPFAVPMQGRYKGAVPIPG